MQRHARAQHSLAFTNTFSGQTKRRTNARYHTDPELQGRIARSAFPISTHLDTRMSEIAPCTFSAETAVLSNVDGLTQRSVCVVQTASANANYTEIKSSFMRKRCISEKM